ncbi:MAG: hypothetical protein L0958_06095 [Candidatus Mariimomonas ferrooxydans]
MDIIRDLIGKEVEVNTIETVYRGVLIEIGDTEIHLQSPYGWITISLDKIAEIKAVE